MVWINEFHYDNAGSDVGEFIEIAGVAGTDLTGWSLVLYNGDSGSSYNSIALNGTIDDEGAGFGAVSVAIFGIQNGAPDAIALVDEIGNVVEFISYEGSLTAVDGPASGLTSTDIGVIEPGTTPIGVSLQLTGSGDEGSDFTWSGPSAASPGDLNVSQTLLCFAAGTRILTKSGEVAVEALKVGQKLVTRNGALADIKWIARQTAHKLRHGPHMQPVCIRAGALGDGLPHSDLTVTADHGMMIDGLLINASALINGSTIDFVPMAKLDDSFTVYHIETENHEVILANGAPTETFVDYAERQAFVNYGDYIALYGNDRLIPEMACPRISSARLVPETIRQRLGINDVEIDCDLSGTAVVGARCSIW